MGLFSGKKKTVVNTSMSRLIDDSDIPDIGTSAIYDYLFGDIDNRNNTVSLDRSYATSLNNAQANSIAAKLNTARRWADDHYFYDVPQGNMLDPDQVDISNLMDEYLTRTLGKPVRISYALFGPTNALHMAWQNAVNKLQYDPTTNTTTFFSATTNQPVYLNDIQVRYCKYTTDDLIDPETVYQYGLPATYGKTYSRKQDFTRKQTVFITDESLPYDQVNYSFSFMVNGKEVINDFSMNLLDFEWSGAPPTEVLDDNDTNNIEPEAVAPIVDDHRKERDYIMVQYFYMNEDNTESIGYFTYEYNSGGIPELDNLFTVRNQLGRYYPNIYFRLDGRNLAADTEADTPEYKSSKALCRKLSLDYAGISDEIHKAVGSVGDVTQILISTQIQVNADDDLIREYLFEYFYSLYNQLPNKFADTAYTSLNTEYVNGYAKVGLTSQIADKVYDSRITFNTIGYVDEQKVIGDVGKVVSSYTLQVASNRRGASINIRSTVPVHTFTKQITATSCRTITVYGLASTQVVSGGYTTTASGQDENLVIPLDDAIARNFNFRDRTKIYSKSLIVIINTLKVIKTKWYQTGIFKAIMFVVAVVVSVYTGGQGMTLYAVLYAAAQTLVIGAVLNLVIKFMVNKLNIQVGALFAVVAVVLIVVGAAAYLSETGKVMGLTSSQIMQLANNSIKISSMGNQLEIKNMVKAMNNYGLAMQDKMDELQELQQQLETDTYLNPYYLMSDSIRTPDIRVGESMNDFITRTLSTNIGTGTTAMIANMVDLTVRLPTFQESIYKIQRGTN